MSEHTGWASTQRPVVHRAEVVETTLCDDEPVAVVMLHDIADDIREIRVTPYAALTIAIELLAFVRQVGTNR